MNFILKGVAKEVFSKINAMSEASINGGNIFYEGCRHGQDPGNIAIIRIEIKPADIGGMPARQVDARPFDPHHSQVLYNHSPDGFEWGYSGSGPAQLALALLLDATGDKIAALKYHQEFKEKFRRPLGSQLAHRCRTD